MVAKEKKQKGKNGAAKEETKTGYGDKKLEGPNSPAE